MTRKISAEIVSQERIASDVCSMWLQTGDMAREAKAGQFINIFSADRSRLLPRPISICRIDPEKGLLRVVYRIVGAGTEEFSRLQAGDSIQVMGPLGNGYPIEEGRALLIAGGIGIPPMLQLAHSLPGPVTAVLGYRSERFLEEEFAPLGDVLIAAEDGSCGTKGTVMDALQEHPVQADVIYSCGPAPMLRAVKDYARDKGIKAWLSLEERMACGVGACLGCVCKSTAVDDHTRVHNKRVCKDGPVFEAGEVDLS